MQIYFDNAATTPPLPFTDATIHANPSSPHALGLECERALTQARQDIAKILACNPNEITFTSGGTESNNLAIIGFALANRRRRVTFHAAPWEHPSILEPLKFIDEQGLGQTQIAPPNQWEYGGDRQLIAISHINHETGDINDIDKIVSSQKRQSTTILVDGVQGFCKEDINITGVDMYTFSAHKTHGPTGVGGLVTQNTRIVPLLHGGGQENKKRAGTENVRGIIHMAQSAKVANKNKNVYHTHVKEIKTIISQLTNELPNTIINSQTSVTSPYILNISFLGIKGEVLVHMLSERGVYVATGAACHSRKKTKTTLEAMGMSREIANSVIRLSFSHLNTMHEAEAAKTIIADCVTQLRKL